MTKYEKLLSLLAEKPKVSGLNTNSLRTSVQELLSDGIARTGASRWISARYGARKAVWTNDVSSILTKLGIEHKCGNDAPRGGANGEYVKVTSPAFIREVKKVQAERKARWEAEKKEAAEKAAIAEAQRQAHHKRMTDLVGENIDAFRALDLHALVPQIHTDWNGRYYFTKKESAAVAHTISEASGLDYQLCIWFVRGERFMEIYNNNNYANSTTNP